MPDLVEFIRVVAEPSRSRSCERGHVSRAECVCVVVRVRRGELGLIWLLLLPACCWMSLDASVNVGLCSMWSRVCSNVVIRTILTLDFLT